jgi:hypothetical protein
MSTSTLVSLKTKGDRKSWIPRIWAIGNFLKGGTLIHLELGGRVSTLFLGLGKIPRTFYLDSQRRLAVHLKWVGKIQEKHYDLNITFGSGKYEFGPDQG